MIKITVDNSFSKIEGLEPSQFTALRKLLSYSVSPAQARFIQNPMNRVTYLIDKKGNFPTGLLPKVKSYLSTQSAPGSISDKRSKAPMFKHAARAFKSTFNVQPYEDQVNAVKAALATDRGVLSLPTGCGKSLVIGLLLAQSKLKALIVVPTLELQAQLTETLTQSLNSMEGITVLNIDSKKLKTPGDYDLLLIDEAHHSASKTYRELNKRAWSSIRLRYALTATPFRNAPEEQLLYESVVGEVIYTLAYADAVRKDYIVPVECSFIDLPKVPVEGFTYAQVYSELVVNNEHRNQVIAKMLLTLQLSGTSTLCLVKEIKHGQILSELTGLPFVCGADAESREHLRDFNTGEIKVLIGTTGVCGEGSDTKPCEVVIIASPGKAKSQLLQQCGRGVRKYPGKESAKIVLFRDKSHRFMLRHFNISAKIIKEYYLTDVTKLELE